MSSSLTHCVLLCKLLPCSVLKLTTFAETKVPDAHTPAPLCSSASIQPRWNGAGRSHLQSGADFSLSVAINSKQHTAFNTHSWDVPSYINLYSTLRSSLGRSPGSRSGANKSYRSSKEQFLLEFHGLTLCGSSGKIQAWACGYSCLKNNVFTHFILNIFSMIVWRDITKA